MPGASPRASGTRWNPNRVGERLDRSREIVDGDDDVVDARRDRVEAGAQAVRCGALVGRRVGSLAGDLDAMRLGEQHAEQLLGEVGVDAGVDRPLTPRS